mgnify:CR=1 FL=1
MTIDREAIYEALFAQLQTAGSTFRFYTRRWRSTYDDENERLKLLPMLVQWEQNENIVWTNRGAGRILTLSTMLEVYAKIPPSLTGPPGQAPDTTTPGSSVLNPLLDAIDTALEPDDQQTGLCTLGGLVIDCRVQGNIVKVLGDADPSGLCGALVPIEIEIVPS